MGESVQYASSSHIYAIEQAKKEQAMLEKSKGRECHFCGKTCLCAKCEAVARLVEWAMKNPNYDAIQELCGIVAELKGGR